MTKFIIIWDAGFGESADIVDATDQVLAVDEAYDRWKEEAEGAAEYRAIEYTEEYAEFFGLE